MNSEQFIKLLFDTEHSLTRRKQNALIRGSWTKVIEIEAQVALCGDLRKAATELSMSGQIEKALNNV